jgi:hypothetical protein
MLQAPDLPLPSTNFGRSALGIVFGLGHATPCTSPRDSIRNLLKSWSRRLARNVPYMRQPFYLFD